MVVCVCVCVWICIDGCVCVDRCVCVDVCVYKPALHPPLFVILGWSFNSSMPLLQSSSFPTSQRYHAVVVLCYLVAKSCLTLSWNHRL